MSKPFEYPPRTVSVYAFDGTLEKHYTRPDGALHDWPPVQVDYLGAYLATLDCKTVIEEDHYIDRDYIEDFSHFHSRSLRNYDNHCRRLHFFSRALKSEEWRGFLARAREDYDAVCRELTADYLGFTVIRPLPGRPVGRTVLESLGAQATNHTRDFNPLRRYKAHLCGLELQLRALAFQQQDQAVSACATAATWCAIQSVAHREHLVTRSPAEITLAASRYLMLSGRSLPSEGLGIQQICEAIRDAGLAPVLLSATSLEIDRANIYSYLRSGLPVILTVRQTGAPLGQPGHAICAVGMKLGESSRQSNPARNYLDAATTLDAVYVHDDRLGPYAAAVLEPLTVGGPDDIRTGFQIQMPGGSGQVERWQLVGIAVPVPNKLRLSVSRLRDVGHTIGQSLGSAFPQLRGKLVVQSRYGLATEYLRTGFAFGLSPSGLETLVERTVLSRYVALVEVAALGEPLVDVLLDCTEAVEQPSVLAIVNRSSLPPAGLKTLDELAQKLAAPFIQ